MATKVLSNILIIIFIIPSVLSDADHWSYNSQNEWKPKICRTGSKQSPIDIETRSASINTSLHIDFKHYANEFQNFIITNNGHTAQLSIDVAGNESTRPFITGLAVNNQEYIFEQLHFHWSNDKGRGSEHTINGKRYSMEMHIVHYNKKYSNITEAVNHQDGLAVLGVLYEITRKDNPHLNPLIDGIKYVRIQGTDDYKNIHMFRQQHKMPSLVLDSLLPNDYTQFFRYKGSLTTPPCSESVTWLLFHDTSDIGLKQIIAFRELMDTNKVPLSETFRHLQSTYERKIETSVPVTGMASHLVNDLHITQLSIITSLLLFTKF